MRRLVCALSAVLLLAGCTAPTPSPTPFPSLAPVNEEAASSELAEAEIRGCFDYFWNETNADETSAGYGLTRDNTTLKDRDFCSIAATGFALCAYVIGAEKGFVTKNLAEERAFGTLKTFAETLETYNGFFYHFYHFDSGKPYDCEVSTIDTALFLCGAAVAAEYFGGEVEKLFGKIYEKVDFQSIVKSNNRFYMSFEKDGQGKRAAGEWDVAAEQLAMYVLGAGSPTYPVGGDLFYSFARWNTSYGEYKYIRSWSNSMFVYLYSHAFIDFRGKTDREGVDWFANSRNAVLAGRQYCVDNEENSATYGENSWGLSACAGPNGYNGSYGARPSGMPGGEPLRANDGTIALYAAVSAMPFTPEESLAALANYAGNEKLVGKYGLVTSYNADRGGGWVCGYNYGIDKGITLVMLANAQNGLIWALFGKNEAVMRGLEAVEVR